jgi:hypothetical protein
LYHHRICSEGEGEGEGERERGRQIKETSDEKEGRCDLPGTYFLLKRGAAVPEVS